MTNYLARYKRNFNIYKHSLQDALSPNTDEKNITRMHTWTSLACFTKCAFDNLVTNFFTGELKIWLDFM